MTETWWGIVFLFYYYACKTVFTLFVASSVRSLLRDSRLCTQASYFFLWVILNHAVHFDVVTIFICPLDGVSPVSTRVTSIVSSGNDYSSHCDKNLFLNWQFNGLFFFFFLNYALRESIISNWVKYRVSKTVTWLQSADCQLTGGKRSCESLVFLDSSLRGKSCFPKLFFLESLRISAKFCHGEQNGRQQYWYHVDEAAGWNWQRR